MTEAQMAQRQTVDYQRARLEQQRDRRRRAVSVLIGKWDYDHPCTHCGFIWLTTSSVGERKRCCREGLAMDPDSYPRVRFLPPFLENLLHDENFAKFSNSYNNILNE
jgi:hypothetical protein